MLDGFFCIAFTLELFEQENPDFVATSQVHGTDATTGSHEFIVVNQLPVPIRNGLNEPAMLGKRRHFLMRNVLVLFPFTQQGIQCAKMGKIGWGYLRIT